jgi:hypothetical protein
MILCNHADAGFHNESKGCSRTGAHIFVSKYDLFPKHNSPGLSISQIMKFAMSSATKAKLGALYTTANKEMVPLHQTLIKMSWLQPCTPIQTDNLTAVSTTNLTILSRKRPSPWTSAFGGSNAETITTGIKAATIGQTSTPITTHQSTMSPTDPHMLVQQAYYHLKLLPHLGPAKFS